MWSISVGEGWTIIAACTPSKTPRSSMRILPPPPSSAGVPMTLTVMPRSSASGARARAAPTADAAMMLWPHAWPMPGRASYSAQMLRTSGPLPAVATNAVGRSATPASTVKPASFEGLRAPPARLLLLEAQLGVGVDPVAQLDEGVGPFVDELLGSGLRIRGRHAPCLLPTLLAPRAGATAPAGGAKSGEGVATR